MAFTAYLSLTGQKQGQIKGSVTRKGREGKILVIGVQHELLWPRDAASGQATGKRMHKPFVITKQIDQSSPRLYAALVGNEKLPSWELQFWAPSGRTGTGAEVMRYTVRLSDAVISGIRLHMSNDAEPARDSAYEEVSFVYRKIEWTWVAGGVTSSDTAARPGAAPKAGTPAKTPARTSAKTPARAARPRA